ncbi:interleukin-1 receptor-associated kinase 4-like isoform X2 [Zophobas morio]|uniref:interleukin-1 receptor-associated kinase 4-like isoform X2 n=1 Tax=Zophobas morio TaxID=2755281 RepID=UPI0030828E50
MNVELEIRKLPLAVKFKIVEYLEEEESWKKLMSIIPCFLTNDYQCDISLNNPPKYQSQHFHIIQNASNLTKRFCSEILLREWATSGRIRPALGHLKYLLEKAQLFHAADFVTVDLLKQQKTRPTKGPGAPIVLNSEEIEDSETKRIEKMLDAINYPSSAIENICKQNSVDTNLNYTTKEVPKMIPKIVISESPEVEEAKPTFNVPVVVQNERNKSESDLIKFSKSLVESDNNVPNKIPDLTSLLESCPSNSEHGSSSSNNIPLVVEDISEDSSSDNIHPNISSLLGNSSEVIIPALSDLSPESSMSSSSNFPALSHLLGGSDSIANKTRSCASPLPNLSLNTPLPHFTYAQLENATCKFDQIPLIEGGRFLGSGSFGQVYLAKDLFNQPVAVKRLTLENAEVVQIDDRVTKQFITEVEILSKYKHENLVSLLGYSCDGLTYCLVYEYVVGGALKDRLEKKELIWTERLYIALGTARAIAYLHTAYSTPLIHRDVKSANILLDVTNKPKLCDFGLIKHSLNQSTNTVTTIIGTSAYMAPEAFRGDVSPKLDTFSFGVVLLELLTSKPPMDDNREGKDLVTHVDDTCSDDITPLLDVSVGSWSANEINFGQKLYEIAQSCLQEKKQRPLMASVCSNLGELIEKSA